ncbi:SusC/RagA family TonB-linked outer membrane protein [Rhizosphaericola mali]|uniref:TonB-dependent receptor n=1 Tax=Rhizosphaericola mali TaxID=2545455 RepID=A0A5P2FY67_9BACT|nr:TonB-dependent receptor [Rhizosphaericola mali]QES88125.1 TonB-dependent receptor [Rhizosphaericola mali]
MKIKHILMLTLVSSGALLSIQSKAQQDHINIQSILKGNIVDSASQVPLEGALINIEGTTNQTFTDNKGQFLIKTGQKLPYKVRVELVGYTTKHLEIYDTSTTITLQQKVDSSNDVVVIGYGTQKRKNLLGAQSTFDAKNIEEKPISRVEQALIGQLPGVQVRQQSGMPGAGLSILVRGSGSLSAGTEPLYVIDGFPLDVVSQGTNGSISNSPLNNLSPNDIESIQVLKDAAAGAIYGSRAANGVVLITTKRGKSGKAQISFNSNTGISSVAKKLDVLSPEDWIKQASAIADSNWVNSAPGRSASQTEAERIAILGTLNTSLVKDDRWAEPGHPGIQLVDWQNAIYRKALFQNYSLSASGGNDNVHYFIAGNYLNQDGTVIETNYKSYSLRANVEANVSKKLKIGINLAPSFSLNNAPPLEGKDNVLMHAAQYTPVVEDSAGLFTNAYSNDGYAWGSVKLINPYAYLKTSTNLNKITRNIASFYTEYTILPGLVARSTINYDGINRTLKTYVSDQVVVGALSARSSQPGYYSSGGYSGATIQNLVNENTINYNKSFNGGHAISFIAGESYNKVHAETFGLSTLGGYANDIVQTLNNAIVSASGETFSGSTTESNSVLISYYGRAQYSFNSKYLFSASIRKDGSSRFGSNNKWGTFPSLSFGWRISDENFFKNNIHFINDLKFRASWGKAGNNSIGNYNNVETYTSDPYSFGGNSSTAAPGMVVSGIANPNLKWETSNTYDLGFDLTAFSHRVNLTFDVYRKNSKDLLMNLPVLAASGFSTSLQNIGSMQTQGLEIGLNTITIKSGKFTWNTNANIAFNGNKVTSLGPNQDRIEISSAYSGSNAPYLLQVGKPIFSFLVTKMDGILTQQDIDNKVATTSKETVGDPKYYDANGDGKITADDRIIAGHPNPNYTWGLTNTFQYGEWDLSVQAYGQQGGKILSYLGRAIDFPGSTTANYLAVWKDAWSTSNPNYNAPRGKLNSSASVPYVTSNWLYSSDFWRIQNVTLGYSFRKLISTGVLKQARAYVALQNIFTKDHYDGGVNPEAQNTNNSGNSSYPLPGDYGAAPLSKTITLGFNLTF